MKAPMMLILLAALAGIVLCTTPPYGADAVVAESLPSEHTQALVAETLAGFARAEENGDLPKMAPEAPSLKVKRAPAKKKALAAKKSLPMMPPPVRVMRANMMGVHLEAEPENGEGTPAGENLESSGGEEEVTANSSIDTANLWVFILIISFLIGFTVLFEVGKHKLVHMVKGKPHEPIVFAIFSELTVLGFLALICFLIGQTGELPEMSESFFGSSAEQKILLGEMLEDIHMVIFCVMVVVICQTLGMMYMADRESQKWRDIEDRVLTPPQRVKVAERWQSVNLEENKPSEWDLLLGFSPEAKEYNLLFKDVRFMLMRQEFINDENENPTSMSLRRDFSFYLYLSKITGHRLAEVIELGIKAWVGLLATCCVFIVANLMASGSWNFLYFFWLIWSWGLLLLAHLFRAGLRRTLTRICHSCEGMSILASLETVNTPVLTAQSGQDEEKDVADMMVDAINKDSHVDNANDAQEAQISGPGSGTGTGSGTSAEPAAASENLQEGLLESDAADTTSVQVQEAAGGGRKWINSKPRYLDDASLDEPTTPWWCKPFKEEEKRIADPEKRRFYNLFYFGKHEVEFQLFVIRSIFLAVSVYTSVFLLHVIPDYIYPAYDFGSALVLTFFGLAPPVIVYTNYIYEIIQLSVMVTSVEHFRDRRTIDTVQRVQKERRSIMLLRVIIALTEDGDEEGDTQKDTQVDLDDSLEVEGMATIFDALDTDGSGTLHKEELGQLFKNFGFDLSSTSVDKAGNVEDPIERAFGDLISDGMIDRAEFLAFMHKKSLKARGYSPEHVTEFCFKKWDVDQSGLMTVDELQEGLALLGEKFSPSEVSAIIVELDVNGDGEFDKHEFEEWLEKYEEIAVE